MTQRGRPSVGLAVWCLLLLAPAIVFADTIYLKEKKTLKGIIVEEQGDRYLLNTVDGEIPVLKALIEKIQYNDPEQSYYQLGRQLQRAGRLREALMAYQKAAELQPGFQAAKEAAFNVQRLLGGQDESEVLAEIRQRRLVMERAGRSAQAPTAPAAPTNDFDARFGCSVHYDNGWTVISRVRPNSPAAVAGLRAGDLLVSIWNEPIAHLSPAVVGERLAAARGELALTIERTASLSQESRHPGYGLQVAVRYDGLRVVSVVPGSPSEGLVPGDLIVELNGRPGRYLTTPQAQQILASSPRLEVTLYRSVTLRSSAS